jgi:hypothetical protein
MRTTRITRKSRKVISQLLIPHSPQIPHNLGIPTIPQTSRLEINHDVTPASVAQRSRVKVRLTVVSAQDVGVSGERAAQQLSRT